LLYILIENSLNWGCTIRQINYFLSVSYAVIIVSSVLLIPEIAFSLHKVKQIDGKVLSIDRSAMTLIVTSGKEKEIVLHVKSSTMLMKNNTRCTVDDINKGDRVKVKYTEIDGYNAAKSILIVSE
jgi:hypothetical protein